jgi:hypothetical protein
MFLAPVPTARPVMTPAVPLLYFTGQSLIQGHHGRPRRVVLALAGPRWPFGVNRSARPLLHRRCQGRVGDMLAALETTLAATRRPRAGQTRPAGPFHVPASVPARAEPNFAPRALAACSAALVQAAIRSASSSATRRESRDMSRSRRNDFNSISQAAIRSWISSGGSVIVFRIG